MPHVIFQRERIPPIELNESFIYQGKQLNFGLNIENIKTDIINDMIKYVRIIDKLPLTPLNKISIVQVYAFNKLRWKFSIYDLTETCVYKNTDKIILKFVRKWFQLPVCANAEHLSFPLSKLGVNFKSAKMLYNKCKLSTHRQSKNPEIQKLCTVTSFMHINHDCLINYVSTENQNQVLSNKQFISKADRKFNKSVFNHTWNRFLNLNEQPLLLCHILKVCPVKVINMWQALAKRLPSNIFNFCRKALISCLPNKSNFYRWKIEEDNQCFLCHHMQTQLHVLPNCEKCLNIYTWRHDSMLNSFLQHPSKILKTSSKIYCNSKKLQYHITIASQLFITQCPDIAILGGDQMTMTELTICFENNALKSREYKIKRYKDLKSQLLQPVSKFKVLFLEITSLWFIGKESCKLFAKYLESVGLNRDHAIFKCMETAIRVSYFIFCRRNKFWTDSELLNYVYSDWHLVHMSYFNRHILIIKLLKIFQPICTFQVVKLLSLLSLLLLSLFIYLTLTGVEILQ